MDQATIIIVVIFVGMLYFFVAGMLTPWCQSNYRGDAFLVACFWPIMLPALLGAKLAHRFSSKDE